MISSFCRSFGWILQTSLGTRKLHTQPYQTHGEDQNKGERRLWNSATIDRNVKSRAVRNIYLYATIVIRKNEYFKLNPDIKKGTPSSLPFWRRRIVSNKKTGIVFHFPLTSKLPSQRKGYLIRENCTFIPSLWFRRTLSVCKVCSSPASTKWFCSESAHRAVLQQKAPVSQLLPVPASRLRAPNSPTVLERRVWCVY